MTHTDEIFSAVAHLVSIKECNPPIVTRCDIEHEMVSNPDKYPIMGKVGKTRRRVMISTVCNSRYEIRAVHRRNRAWTIREV